MLELLFETDRSMMKFQNVIPDTVLGFLLFVIIEVKLLHLVLV